MTFRRKFSKGFFPGLTNQNLLEDWALLVGMLALRAFARVQWASGTWRARAAVFPLRRWTRRYSSQRDEFHLSVLMRQPWDFSAPSGDPQEGWGFYFFFN